MKKIIFITITCLILASCAPISSILGPAQPGSGAVATAIQPQNGKSDSPVNVVAPTSTMTPSPQASKVSSVPNFDHIILMVLENQDYQNVIGSTSMPRLNALAQQNVLLTNYFAISHPSLPNYIALVSGSTQGITSDCTNCFVNQPNLADEIEASGRTWKAYMENLPSPCFVGDANPYAQKHDPFLYFDSIRTNPTRCDNSIVPLTQLDSDLSANKLPNFAMIGPNLCNSGHNCTQDTADNWASGMVAKLQASPALGKNSLIIITFDEASTQDKTSCCGLGKGGGEVATVLISPTAQAGFTDKTAYSHYSLLKTILTAWNLPDLGKTSMDTIQPIEAPWNTNSSTAPSSPDSTATPISGVSAPAQIETPTKGCSSSSPASADYSAKVCFSTPSNGSTLTGEVTISATVDVTGAPSNVGSTIFYLDGTYLLTDYYSPYTFTLPTEKWIDGNHMLSVEAVMKDKFTTPQAGLSVVFSNGVTSQPVNNNTFQPVTGIPPANDQPFIVAAGGDGASGGKDTSNVVDLITSLNPNLFLYLGDVYENGSLAEFYNWYGTSSTFFGQLRAITDPTVGNHEYLTKNATPYFDYWNNIPSYYSFNANGWHFISLNSNASQVPIDSSSAQYQWLQKDLAANARPCTVVFYHHPFFNIGPEGSTAALADVWKLMAQNKVSIVLNGHDHDYQRWVPLNGDGQPSPNGITEFVVGSAGHGLQTFTKSDSRVAYSNDTHPAAFGVLLLQLNQSGANFTYQSTDGSILDSGVIPCAGATANTQAPSVPGGLSATIMSSSRVDLTWSAANDDTGVAGYAIYRNGAAIATVPGYNLTYSDTTVAPAITYKYAIFAFDSAGKHSAATALVPVTIPGVASSKTFSPVADTYVNSGNPGSNYGRSPFMRLNSSPDMHGYMRFTVSGLSGRAIKHVGLLLYFNNSNKQGISLYSVDSKTWSELSTNYVNAPAVGKIVASTGAFTAGSWVTLDLTNIITGEGTFNFSINTPGTKPVSLASRESGANAPQLVIDFQP